MEKDLGYVLARILEKLEGSFVCVLGDRTGEFESGEAFKNSDFGKKCELTSIRVKDGKIVLELEKLPPVNDLGAPWVQEYIRQYGREPSFFDF
jgi:hypothetical protein